MKRIQLSVAGGALLAIPADLFFFSAGNGGPSIQIVNADGTGLYTVAGAGEGSDAVWLP